MPALSAHNVAIERGGKRVVAPLSVELAPGTITAICGPNGAGKSSLIMALAGLIPPVQGTVELGKAKISSLSASERAQRIGYLPQSVDIAWDVAVERLIALGRHPFSDARSETGEAAIKAAIAATAVEELRQRPSSKLSGGERARVLLARVLAGEPEWILADEPLAALDLAHQIAMVSHFKECAKAGQGVVIVLHDLALAMNHADHVLVLKEGEVIADGPPEKALSPDAIALGWGVQAQWLGEQGKRALIAE